jgi:hypothetical protein
MSDPTMILSHGSNNAGGGERLTPLSTLRGASPNGVHHHIAESVPNDGGAGDVGHGSDP